MKNVLLTALLFSTFAASANTDWRFLGTLSMGSAWENAGEKQTLSLAPGIEKTYTADENTQALLDGELFLGVQKAFSKTSAWQLGVSIVSATSATLSGNIWDDADPEFNNYTYDYQIQHTHLAVKGKFLFTPVEGWLTPWLSASVGVGFNHAYGFSNQPIIFEAVASPDFESNTQTTFIYTVGVGVQKILNEHLQLGAGYEFSDWGKSQLNKAAGQMSGNGLTLDHFYTSALMFNLTYLL